MKPVIVESPYAGHVSRNVEYAKRAMVDCLRRFEAPFASHLLYTQCLNDTVANERDLGIQAGFVWHRFAQMVVVYTDYGISEGMQRGIDNANRLGIPVEFRTIGQIT